MTLPPWSEEIRTLYLSGAANQFILHGNTSDRLLLPEGEGGGDSHPQAPGDRAPSRRLGNLPDFLVKHQLAKFDVVLACDLGAGVRVLAGDKLFQRWPGATEALPKTPAEMIVLLDRFLRFCVNLRVLRPDPGSKSEGSFAGRNLHVAIIFLNAQLLFPAARGLTGYDLNALASVVRSWSLETHFLEQNLAVFLVSEQINDLHPLLAMNPRAARLEIKLPGPSEMSEAFRALAPLYPKALEKVGNDLPLTAERLAGATLSAVESLLKRREFLGEPLMESDLSALKRQLVEQDAQGLIEFLEPDRTLEDVQGQASVKEWMRQDIALWRQGDLAAMPMGYLFCGPVGTGKTYLVECLAGEAGVPVVKLKNFRDRWVGSTEGNLEKIFSLLQALGRCIVFIDEADQALGRRDGGAGDSGVGGRVYSMMAKEMSNTRNRGRVLWILASSRPDLIEIDLKRPGRVDVKIPLFPASGPEETYSLIRALGKKQSLELPKALPDVIRGVLPEWVTPGSAESLAIKVYRLVKTRGVDPVEALRDCLDEYQNPVPQNVMEHQIGLAVDEASDLAFVPEVFRQFRTPGIPRQ